MPKPSPETIAKIRQLQAYNLAEPKRFNLNYWGGFVNFSKSKDQIICDVHGDADFANVFLEQRPPCGAIGCNAGNICIMAGLVKPTEVLKDIAIYEFGWDTPQLASKWLGIDQDTATNLFFLESWGYRDEEGNKLGWPDEFARELLNFQPGSLEYAMVNHRRLDFFCETGE